jgi:hypothetical protein
MKQLPPQSKTVLAHLRSEGSLSHWEAQGVYQIRRLASRIDEIVAAGWDVVKEEKRDANGNRYLRYSLSAAQMRVSFPLHPPRVRESRFPESAIETAMEKLGFDSDDFIDLINELKATA